MNTKKLCLIFSGIFLLGAVVGAGVTILLLATNTDVVKKAAVNNTNDAGEKPSTLPPVETETVIFDNTNRGGMPIYEVQTFEDVKKMLGAAGQGIGIVSFYGAESAANIADAQNKVQEKINSALAAVRKFGVTDEYIRMRITSIPMYNHPDAKLCIQMVGADCDTSVDWSKATLYGYDVSYEVIITARDANSMNSISSALLETNIGNVTSQTFSEVWELAKSERQMFQPEGSNAIPYTDL